MYCSCCRNDGTGSESVQEIVIHTFLHHVYSLADSLKSLLRLSPPGFLQVLTFFILLLLIVTIALKLFNDPIKGQNLLMLCRSDDLICGTCEHQ